MRLMTEFGPPPLDGSSLDLGLTDEELSIRNKVREFAKEILRPAGVKMDKLPSSETAKPSSPWHSAYQGYKDLGLDYEALFFSDDRVASNRLKAIVWEELGWGDAGLAVTFMLTHLPDFFARSIGRLDLAEEFSGKPGCWSATQRNRGSDAGDFMGMELAGSKLPVPELYATQVEGGFILQGKTSPWVSVSPVAEVCLGQFPLADKDGNPVYTETGAIPCITAIHAMDLDGMSVDAPTDMIGKRTDPMASINFVNVFLPEKYVVADPMQTPMVLYSASCLIGLTISSVFTGLARAAYEHVLAYSHERVQGRRPIVQHQAVRSRLFKDFRKVEACRAVSRNGWLSNAVSQTVSPLGSMFAKSYCTEVAAEVAMSAQQGMGANGLASGFPVEKLVRDTRAGLIADGENNVLSISGGTLLSAGFMAGTTGQNEPYEVAYPL